MAEKEGFTIIFIQNGTKDVCLQEKLHFAYVVWNNLLQVLTWVC